MQYNSSGFEQMLRKDQIWRKKVFEYNGVPESFNVNHLALNTMISRKCNFLE